MMIQILSDYFQALLFHFFLFYVSAQFHASGKVLNSLFHLDTIVGISVEAIIIIIYTLMGGFLAVAWTDLIQGLLMIGTLIILPIAGIIELGNIDMTIKDGLEIGASDYKNNNMSFFMGRGSIDALIVALGGLSWGLGYLEQLILLIRYMAVRGSKEIKIARKNSYCLGSPWYFWVIFYRFNSFFSIFWKTSI